jgi:hypothetical protein
MDIVGAKRLQGMSGCRIIQLKLHHTKPHSTILARMSSKAGNGVSSAQKRFMTDAEAAGCFMAVVFSVDEALAVLRS